MPFHVYWNEHERKWIVGRSVNAPSLTIRSYEAHEESVADCIATLCNASSVAHSLSMKEIQARLHAGDDMLVSD